MRKAECAKLRRSCSGQIATEFSIMLVMCVGIAVLMLLLLGAFTEYGGRLVGLVGWEPNPPTEAQMDAIKG